MGNDEHGPAYPEPVARVHTDGCKARWRHCRQCSCVYVCPICKGDKDRFMTCDYPACPDGRDQHGRFPTYPSEPFSWGAALVGLLMWAPMILLLLFVLVVKPAHALDHGFDPLAPTTQWMESLPRPYPVPSPGSCCGIADAYQADIYARNADGSYEVVITDGSAVEFPDGIHRTPIDDGTKIHVPAKHVNPPKDQMGNPTGHAWLFMSVYGVTTDGQYTTTPGSIYCFIPMPEGS